MKIEELCGVVVTPPWFVTEGVEPDGFDVETCIGTCTHHGVGMLGYTQVQLRFTFNYDPTTYKLLLARFVLTEERDTAQGQIPTFGFSIPVNVEMAKTIIKEGNEHAALSMANANRDVSLHREKPGGGEEADHQGAVSRVVAGSRDDSKGAVRRAGNKSPRRSDEYVHRSRQLPSVEEEPVSERKKRTVWVMVECEIEDLTGQDGEEDVEPLTDKELEKTTVEAIEEALDFRAGDGLSHEHSERTSIKIKNVDISTSEDFDEQEDPFCRCGSCGAYHRSSFRGDCRDDSERYGVPVDDNGVPLEERDRVTDAKEGDRVKIIHQTRGDNYDPFILDKEGFYSKTLSRSPKLVIKLDDGQNVRVYPWEIKVLPSLRPARVGDRVKVVRLGPNRYEDKRWLIGHEGVFNQELKLAKEAGEPFVSVVFGANLHAQVYTFYPWEVEAVPPKGVE